MEKYSKEVREMYSRFEEAGRRRVEGYTGRSAGCKGGQPEVAGYREDTDGTRALIVGGAGIKGWRREMLDPMDVVFKDCEEYAYVDITGLTDRKTTTGNKDSALPYAGRAGCPIPRRTGTVTCGQPISGAGMGDGLENVSSKIQKIWKR